MGAVIVDDPRALSKQQIAFVLLELMTYPLKELLADGVVWHSLCSLPRTVAVVGHCSIR